MSNDKYGLLYIPIYTNLIMLVLTFISIPNDLVSSLVITWMSRLGLRDPVCCRLLPFTRFPIDHLVLMGQFVAFEGNFLVFEG